ncbi:MAG: bifunctional ornithine acetyltransferase/N-acetylglutamate synthase, partial [Kiritimatiellae bacterium]|nr:bifunctional ornithine acetyltransferase/N-acetylglutamate synthase [Kiritimatiellia bacterium]
MVKARMIDGGVCSAKGFRASGVEAAVKYKGRKDVALIVADRPCAAAAVFTTNKVAAAPVLYDREVARGGRAQAILANSGCANACTGEAGLRDARLSALVTAGELGIDPGLVFVASTGVIGRPLPMDRLLGGAKEAVSRLGRTKEHALAAAQAVMTTDTKP